MLETSGDLWRFRKYGWIVVPTNLTVRGDGLAVMGRGVARQASSIYFGLRRYYGSLLREGRRGVERLVTMPRRGQALKLVLLPVKDDWKQQADIGRIEASARALAADGMITGQVFLPMVGCGFGELAPEVVLPVLARELHADRFVLVKRGPGVVEKYPSSFRAGLRFDRTIAEGA